VFPGAPPGPFGDSLDRFTGENANGTWSLYVFDDTSPDAGDIEAGWSTTLTTGPADAAVPGTGSSGTASPYPVTRTVPGDQDGVITDLDVRIDGIWHQRPDDLDLLLVGPRGQKVVLMSDACGNFETKAFGWEWDDETPNPMPDAGPCELNLYRPTDHAPADVWPAPAPPGPYAGTLSAFDLTDPGGDWRLFVLDDSSDKVGFFTNRFQLVMATGPKAEIAFTEDAVQLAEGATRALTLSRSGPAALGDGAVTLTSLPVSASSGSDFRPVSTVVEFAAGEREKTVEVEALADSEQEPDESFLVAIGSPTGDAATSAPSSVALTIPAHASTDPGGSGGEPGGGVDGAPPAFGSKTLVTLALASRRISATGPVAVRVSNANGFQVTGKLSGHSAEKMSASRKRRVGLRSRLFTVGAHGKTTLKLGLPKTLRKLLKRKHQLSLRLRARVSDPAGHTRTVTKTLTPRVKRKRTGRH
jgi:subtilisin-like proprotein convertase family protein